MPLTSPVAHPVLRKVGEANSWAVVQIAINTPLVGALSVDVTVQARKLDADGMTQLAVLEPDVFKVDGPPLEVLMGAAYDAAKQAEAAGASSSQALYLGIRTAVYASLQRSGAIPSDAV